MLLFNVFSFFNFRLYRHFNTSNVTIQPENQQIHFYVIPHFNASNVTIQLGNINTILI